MGGGAAPSSLKCPSAHQIGPEAAVAESGSGQKGKETHETQEVSASLAK